MLSFTGILPDCAVKVLCSIYYKEAQTNYAFHLKIRIQHNRNHNKKIPTVADTDYQDNGSALRQHFKYSLLVCDMKRVFLLHDIMQWDLGRSAEGPCTQKCNEPIVQKTLYCTLTYH